MPTEITTRTKPASTAMTGRTQPQTTVSELWSEDNQPWGEDKQPWLNENSETVNGTELTPRVKP